MLLLCEDGLPTTQAAQALIDDSTTEIMTHRSDGLTNHQVP